jgi:hypothetical protein
MERVLFVLMLSLWIKRRYRDVTVNESGGVSKLEKGMRIAVVGRHHGMNKFTERRQGQGKYYDHSFECRNFICESL